MPNQPIDDLLWRVYREAETLLHDLEAVETRHGGDLAQAGRYIKVITDHVEPLRRVVEAVEFHERAEEVIGRVVGSLSAVTGGERG